MRKYIGPLTGIALIILYTVFPQSANAAISLDSMANSSGVDNTSVTSVTYPITVTTGNVLVICTTASDLTDADRPVTGVTFNGDALSKVREDDDTSGNITTGIWYMSNPAITTGNIVVSYTGTVSRTGSFGIALSGAAVSPIDNSNTTATDNTTTFASSITALTSNAWAIDCTLGQSILTGSPTASDNQIANFSAGSFEFTIGSYAGPVSGATTLDWTGPATSNDWDSSAVTVSVAASGGGNPTWKKQYPQEVQWF